MGVLIQDRRQLSCGRERLAGHRPVACPRSSWYLPPAPGEGPARASRPHLGSTPPKGGRRHDFCRQAVTNSFAGVTHDRHVV